jgi:hypothetical protein
VRKGTANIFCIVEPKTGKRLTYATRRRTNRDFGRALQRVSKAYPRAKRIHLVVDNLSSHTEKACVDAFREKKGRRLWSRFKVHYSPKHGSWLNAAEMVTGLVGTRMCPLRCIRRTAATRSTTSASTLLMLPRRATAAPALGERRANPSAQGLRRTRAVCPSCT